MFGSRNSNYHSSSYHSLTLDFFEIFKQFTFSLIIIKLISAEKIPSPQLSFSDRLRVLSNVLGWFVNKLSDVLVMFKILVEKITDNIMNPDKLEWDWITTSQLLSSLKENLCWVFERLRDCSWIVSLNCPCILTGGRPNVSRIQGWAIRCLSSRCYVAARRGAS